MSDTNKTRFEVQKVIRSVINKGFTDLGMTGWDVIEFANASFQTADKIVLMNYLNSKQLGYQATEYATIDNDFIRTDSWGEIQTWQIHFILKRKSDTDETIEVPEDVAGTIAAYINGKGTDMFLKSGIHNFRIDTQNILVYNDNSSLYQKRAVFTVKLNVPKEIKFEQETAELGTSGIHSV